MSHTKARRTGLWRNGTALVAATLFLAVITPIAAGADPGPTPTKANVVAGSTPPSVDCTWAMPSMDKNNANPVSYYDPATGNSDDDPLTNPTPVSPCSIPGAGLWPTQATGARHLIQVRPNTLNEPSPRRIELWSAVSAEVGLGSISSVFWKVFHPDGSFKAQIHAETLTNGVSQPYAHGVYASPGAALAPSMTRIGDCYGPQSTYPNAGNMFKGASNGVTATNHGNREISAAAIDPTNPDSLITACNEQQKAFFYAGFDLHKEQPCGEYVVEAHAVVNGAEAPVLKYTIDVQCFYDLETDFTTVNWGTLATGSPKTLPGDTAFVLGDGKPTVRNGGNTGMQIGLRYTPLVQSNANGTPIPGGKLITWFDGAFGRDANHLQSIPKIDSGILPGVLGAASYFDGGAVNGQPYYQTLCSDETGKLDLSVHPDANIPSGNYVGSLLVVARRNSGDGLGNGQVWPVGTAQWPRIDVPTAQNNLVTTKLCWQDQDNINPLLPVVPVPVEN